MVRLPYNVYKWSPNNNKKKNKYIFERLIFILFEKLDTCAHYHRWEIERGIRNGSRRYNIKRKFYIVFIIIIWSPIVPRKSFNQNPSVSSVHFSLQAVAPCKVYPLDPLISGRLVLFALETGAEERLWSSVAHNIIAHIRRFIRFAFVSVHTCYITRM